jgi:CheY-like chemotaxis protein
MKHRVLIADDDDAMRATVAFTLDDDGYDTTEAASGMEVLRLMKAAERDGGSTGFDLIVMDIRMPGLSGLDTVKRLRGLECTTPVVLMTAFVTPETADAAERLRVPLLSKPFPLSELRALVLSTLDGAGRTAAT